MSRADDFYLAGYRACLDAAQAAGVAILRGAWGNTIRREHAAAGLCAFVDEARAAMAIDRAHAHVLPLANTTHGPHSEGHTIVLTVAASVFAGAPKVTRSDAVARGYTGDMCPDCANLTMVRNGTCLKCETCGSTTGCS